MKKYPTLCALLVQVSLFWCVPLPAKEAVPGELAAYLAKPEPDYGWTVDKKEMVGTTEVWYLKLTSQKWHDIVWDHDLVVFRPEGAPVDKALILNEGGKAGRNKAVYGALIAAKIKAPVAVVLGVPKQPLYDGLVEDDLIAETFIRYLNTGDGSWPLLFPMVKSVVKGMDAVQELGEKEWGGKPEKFIVGGASKRGWTSWLTAASDPRVMALTPMVIDVLNMQPQLQHQIATFGAPSEQIEPYTKRGLVPMPDTDAARKLWAMVDPWVYRSRLTMPKLIVLGNNDRYWTTDALNLYWDDLPGEKYISYTPNAGHDLTERTPEGKKLDPFRAVNNIAAFVRHQFTGKPMPKLQWKHDDAEDGQLRLRITADPPPREVRLWVARERNKDFRESRWEAQPVTFTPGEEIVALLPRPEKGCVAFYADLGYMVEDIPQWLCTQVRLAEAAGK